LLSEPVQAAPAALQFGEYRNLPWLIRTVAITQLPSVSTLVTLRGVAGGKAGRTPFIGFGDPVFSKQQAQAATANATVATRGVALRSAPLKRDGVDSTELAQLPRLPDTADEIRDIARALKADMKADVLLGAAANEQAVKSADLAAHRVIAFATHGLVPGDLNGLDQPALALSAPDVANIEGDGLLTMNEVLALKLDADWVVLSACNTATGDGAGSEAVSGLGRAFFFAGARALLVSNWPVETTSARAITTGLFQRQADQPQLSRAEALRETLLALIDGPGYVDARTKQAVFSYAHPLFWAPFSLVGDGARR
jgi:CHAT domain-containing protein